MSVSKLSHARQKHPAASAAAWTTLLLSLLMGSKLLANCPCEEKAMTTRTHPNQSDADAMVEWIRSSGGVANVGVRIRPRNGRITVALHDVKKGDELAMIPRRICFHGDPAEDWATGANLWSELANLPQSPYQPYLKMLPSRSEVWSFFDLPMSYIPMIQYGPLENTIIELQQDLQRWHQRKQQDHQHNSTVVLANMTLDQLRYSMSLVTTRAFGTPFGPLMVPLIDMANHHNNCKHTLAARITCGPDMEDGCIVWKAGSDLRSGEEVCLTYHKKMLQDMAVLQYGFLQDDDFSKEMSSIDRHDYDADYFGRSSQPSTSNNTAQLAAEIDRLTALLAAMATFDATLRLGPDASRDQDGVMLRSLITWRQQRQGAIASELRQLSGMLQLAALNETA